MKTTAIDYKVGDRYCHKDKPDIIHTITEISESGIRHQYKSNGDVIFEQVMDREIFNAHLTGGRISFVGTTLTPVHVVTDEELQQAYKNANSEGRLVLLRLFKGAFGLTYHVGQHFAKTDNTRYILAAASYEQVGLLDLSTGTYLRQRQHVQDPKHITQEEFDKMCGGPAVSQYFKPIK